VQVLGHLLVAAGSGISPMMLSLVEKGPTEGVDAMRRLRDELEASLVPLNYDASKRVLARLVRELRRAAPEIRPDLSEHAGELDASVDALLEGRHSDEVPGEAEPAPDDVGAEPPRDAPEPEIAAPDSEEDEGGANGAESEMDGAESRVAMGEARDLRQLDPGGSRRELSPVLVAGVVLVAALFGAYLLGWFDRGAPESRSESIEPSIGALEGTLQDAPLGDLIVRASPAGAEVFQYVGDGPATVAGVPVGRSEEFLLISDGRAPSRALVARNAEWREEADGHVYELAMQAGAVLPRDGITDLGSSLQVDDRGAWGDQVGVVRVITNPTGGRVYRLVGRTPNVRLRELRTDGPHVLLVGAAGRTPQTVTVGPDEWRQVAGQSIAEVELTLASRR